MDFSMLSLYWALGHVGQKTHLSFFVSLSLSIYLLIFSFSLPSLFSFHFALFCFLVFVTLFLCLVSLLLSHQKNNIKTSKFKVVFINPFCLGERGFSLALSLESLFLIFLLILNCVFLFNINVFMFQRRQVKNKKNTIFWPSGGLQQNVF